MKIQTLGSIALCAAMTAFYAGCARTGEFVGAPAYADQDVLTGGPLTGIRLADLPQAVRNTLKEQVPTAQVAGIEHRGLEDKTAYHVRFTDAARFPSMLITSDGTVLEGGPRQQKQRQ